MAFSNSRTEFPPGICNSRPKNYSSVTSARGSANDSGQRRLPAPNNGGRESCVPQSPLPFSPEESQFPPSPYFSPYPSPLPPSGQTSSGLIEAENVELTTVDLSQLLQQNTGSSLSAINSGAGNSSGSKSQIIPTEPKNPHCKRPINSEKGNNVKRQKKQQVKAPVPITSLDEVNIPEHTLQQNMSSIIHDEAIEPSSDTIANNYPNPFMGEGFGFNDEDISQVDSDNLARLLAYFLLNCISSTMQNMANDVLTAPSDLVDNILVFLNQIQSSWNSAVSPDNPHRLQANAMWRHRLRPSEGSLNFPNSNGMGLPPQDNSYFDVSTMVPEGATSETHQFPHATALTNNQPSGYILPTEMFNRSTPNSSTVAAFSEPGPSRIPTFPNDFPSATITPPQTPLRQSSTGQSMGPPEHHSIDVVKGEGPYVHTLWRIKYTDWTKIIDLWKHYIDPENQNNNKKANIGLNQLIKTIFSYDELLTSTLSGRKGANEMPALNREKLLILYAYVAYIKNNPNNRFPENAISIETKLTAAGIKYVKHWVSQLCHETKTRHNRQ